MDMNSMPVYEVMSCVCVCVKEGDLLRRLRPPRTTETLLLSYRYEVLTAALYTVALEA